MKILYKIIFLFILLNNGFVLNAKTKKTEVAYHFLNNIASPVASISGTTTVCQNAATPVITFTGSGGTAPYTFTYTINGGSNLSIATSSSNAITLNVSTANLGSFVYALVSVSDSSSPVQTQTQSESATVTVKALPAVDFTSDATSGSTCSGDLIQFTSTITSATASPYTYLWDFEDGTTSTAANPVHALSSLGCRIGTVKVTLTITDTNGCSGTKTKDINVIQKPDIDFKDNNSAFSPFSNCQNATVATPNYSISVGNNSASNCITSYSIDWGDGNSESNFNNFPKLHTYTQLGAYNMVITALGTNGCTNSKTYVVRNVTNPSGGIVSPGSTTYLCAPTADLIFGISAWGSNTLETDYAIDYGDGSPILHLSQSDLENSSYYTSADPSTSANYPLPVHSYITSSCPSAEFIAKLTITNACSVTAATVSNITVFIKPEANFTVATSSCSNTSVQFTNTTISGFNSDCTTKSIYTWDFGDGSATTSTENGTHSYATPGIYTVTLTAEGSTCGKSTITKQICIEAPLIPTFTLSTPTEYCSPGTVTTNNTTAIDANACVAATYLWKVSYASGNCGSGANPITDQTTQNATYSFVTPGTYSITLTATNSCGSVVSPAQVVVVKRPPTVVINSIADSCGPITINPAATITNCGNQSPLTYEWNFPGGNPSTSTDASPGSIIYNAAGTYTISLTVTNECGPTIETTEFTIKEVPVLTNTDLSQTICSGMQTTLVNLTSDLAGTTFSWTALATTGISGFTSSGTTNSLPAQTIATTATSPGTVTYSITPLLNGCAGVVVDYVVDVNPAPTITQPQSSSVCIGGTPTILSVTVSNATSTPTYEWYSNTVNTNSGGALIPGETNATYAPPALIVGTIYYYCIITLPSGGCTDLLSNTAAVTIADVVAINTQPKATQTICEGATIDPLVVGYTGGTGTATYQWYSNTSNSSSGGTLISSETAASFTPAIFDTSGTFYFYATVILSGNNCGTTSSDSAEIIVVANPTLSSPIGSQVLCQGSTPMDLTVTPAGGIGPNYSYQWYSHSSNLSTGGTKINGEVSDTYTPPTTSPRTTYYYVEVQQAGLGCSVTSTTAEIIVNETPVFTSQPISESICLNEEITLSVVYNNGTGTPQYQWFSTTSNSTSGGVEITGETASSYTFSAINIGSTYYYVTASSSAGCSDITSTIAEVKVSQNPVITNQSISICSGDTFTILPDNSTGDIVPSGTTYTWINPTIYPASSETGASVQNTPQTNISQALTNTTNSTATVTYTVTPLSGVCTGANFTIVVTVNPALSPNVNSTDISCFGANDGSIQTTITGGIPFGSGSPYKILWTYPDGFTNTTTSISNIGPGNYTLSITDDSTCSFSKIYEIKEPTAIIINTDLEKDVSCFGNANGSIAITITGGTPNYTYVWTKDGTFYDTTEDLSNLEPGEYVVTVSDVNDCGPKTASFTITEPLALSIELINKTDILCFGDTTGAITIDQAGGILPYSYAWTGPNGFTSSNQNLNTIPAGNYTVTVTEASGCSQDLEVSLTENPEISIAVTKTEIICYDDNNGTIKLVASGGVGPYTYSWSNLASGDFQDNLSAGDYVITVTDAIECTKTITVTITEPPIFTTNPIVKQISCFGAHDASINLNLVGGISPISIAWNDGSTAGLTRNNLGPGTYTATITDGKPCTITKEFSIMDPAALVLSASVKEALDCDNANSGAIDLLVSGGTAPFSYAWSNGATTEDLINIPAATYSVTVTDARGCTQSIQKTINRPLPLVVQVETKTEVDCDTRYIQQTFIAQGSGGVHPYKYDWSSGTVSGSNDEMMRTSENGTVILNITDNLGCSANYSFNVSGTRSLGTPSFNSTSYAYTNYGIYSINDPIQFTNTATGDYLSIIWDFGDGTFSTELNPMHIFINPKEYVVTQTVTYPFGCIYAEKTTFTVGKGYLLVVPNAFTPNKDNLNDTFRPVTKALKNVHLDIYDTWGSMIYSETADVLRGWDGTIKGYNAENGNYFCKVSGETFYGTIVNENHPFVLIK